jgi:muramoyltetrapeptide carboxypeptidase LdcA involved in peptidoglycan recycling
MTTVSYPPKPSPGDRIAVVSPSGGLPELFPLPYELGLERLRKEYGLEPAIGGDDQITVLPLLDRELIRVNPKPFFGMSDNTILLAFLRNRAVGCPGAWARI